MRILVVNAGSTSLKLRVLDDEDRVTAAADLPAPQGQADEAGTARSVEMCIRDRPETAFQLGLRQFSGLLAKIAAGLTVSIFVVNLIVHHPILDALLFSLAIAVGITPQLLPAVVTTSLATGSRRLARQKVLVKRLVGIEDLGNVEVLFTDKTGTLTAGRIVFQRATAPTGGPSDDVLFLGLLCNEATPAPGGPLGGNQLDRALWDAPGTDRLPLSATRRLAMLPFDQMCIRDSTRP